MKNPTEPMIPRNYKVGDRVYGVRLPNAYKGEFVRAYVTINENYLGIWRNPAYVIKCDVDGKERSFQNLWSISKGVPNQCLYIK